MKQICRLSLACLIAALGLSGCFKAKEEFVLNPDSSGKVTYAVELTPHATSKALDADERAVQMAQNRRFAESIASKSEGVKAWKDVAISSDKDGKVTFRGTAYFQDITKLKLPPSHDLFARWKPAADGTIQLELGLDMDKEPVPAEPPTLTEEEIAKKIVEAKARMAQRLSMMEQLLGDVRVEWTFTLPGPVEKTVNFQPVADQPSTVRLVFEGRKYVELMKAVAMDDAHLRAKIVAGKDPSGPPAADVFNENIFGTKGPIMVAFKSDGQPLFDFAAESEAAKQAMPATK